MSAVEIIEQIKGLPASEQAQIARFIAENGISSTPPRFSIGVADDGLPVIHATGGNITSQLVHELESRTP